MDIVNLVLLVSWFIFINSLIDLELSFIFFIHLYIVFGSLKELKKYHRKNKYVYKT